MSKSKKIIIKTILCMLIANPLQTKSQMLTTGISSCEQNPYRRENAYTENPYDDIIYYKCYSTEDSVISNETNNQSRKTCEYTRVVYYNTRMRSWNKEEIYKTCKVKKYELDQEKEPIIPEGWHPPFLTR